MAGSDHDLNYPRPDSQHHEEREKWDQLYRSLPLEAQDEALRQFNHEFATIISEFLPPHSRILEAGAGAGWQSLALAQLNKFDVTLMDFSTEALNYSRRLFEREDASAQFVQADVLEPGRPAFDLVFNAGVLEHYTFEEQVEFLKGMASRSQKYVLVLVPNQQCYWYWVWRMAATAKGDWVFGKEVPLSDLSAVFEAAGLKFLGQRFVAASWTETYIKYVLPADDPTHDQLLEIHRRFPIPDEQKCYLLAALGTVPGTDDRASVPSHWRSDTISSRSDMQTAELFAALSDTLALSAASENRLKELTAQNRLLNIERDQLAHDKRQLIDERQQLIIQQTTLKRERETLRSERDDLAAEHQAISDERDQLIAQRQELFETRDFLISERDHLRDVQVWLEAERDQLVAHQYDLLNTRAALLLEQNALHAEREYLRSERDDFAVKRQALLAERKLLVEDRDYLIGERRELMAQRDFLASETAHLNQMIEAMQSTRAWKAAILYWRTRDVLKRGLNPSNRVRFLYHLLIPLRFRLALRDFRRGIRKQLGLGVPAPITPGSVEPVPMVEPASHPISEIQITFDEIIGDAAAEQGTVDVFIFSIIELEARFQRPQPIWRGGGIESFTLVLPNLFR